MSALWDMPAQSGELWGLGGGIAYAWDPALCDDLLPRFDEDIYGWQFIECANLRAAMERAFASWETHHPMIRFNDVTAECNRTYGSSSGLHDGASIPCPLAELWITARSNATGHEAIANDLSTYNWTRYFRKPNGVYTQRQGVYATSRATLTFNTDLCWYLDPSFCSGLHSLKRSIGVDASLQLGRVVVFGFFTLALMELLYTLARWLRRHLDLLALELVGLRDIERQFGRQGEAVEWREIGRALRYLCCCGRRSLSSNMGDEYVAKSAEALLSDASAHEWFLQLELAASVRPCRTALRLLCLLFPPLFYGKIFLPCYDCFDFEVAAAHEIGHVLGLHHPDQAHADGRNMVLTKATGGTWNCYDEWADVRVDLQPSGSALMAAFTQTPHAAGSCLSQDDLDGLNVLYPTCHETVTEPLCLGHHAGTPHVGWVRLVLFVGLPLVLLWVCMIAIHAYAAQSHERHRVALRKEHGGMGEAELRLIEQRQAVQDARDGKRTARARAASRHRSSRPAALLKDVESESNARGSGVSALVEMPNAPLPSGGGPSSGFGGQPADVDGSPARKSKSTLSDGDRLKAHSAALRGGVPVPTSSSLDTASPLAPSASPWQSTPAHTLGARPPLPTQRTYMQLPPSATVLGDVLGGVRVDGPNGQRSGGTSRLPAMRQAPRLAPLQTNAR